MECPKSKIKIDIQSEALVSESIVQTSGGMGNRISQQEHIIAVDDIVSVQVFPLIVSDSLFPAPSFCFVVQSQPLDEVS